MTGPENNQSPAPPSAPRPKADPASFAIRARPRAVTRLSRRMLITAAGGLALCIGGAVWWAFALHSFRIVTGKQLYNTDVRPSAQAMNGLPKGYAGLTKPKPPPTPAKVPQLGPPLQGDLGSPMPGQPASPDLSATPSNLSEQATARLRAQAALAGVFFTMTRSPSGGGGRARYAAAGRPANPSQISSPDRAHLLGANLTGRHTNPGGQGEKQDFLDSSVDRSVYSPDRLQRPISPYELMAGSVVPAALITGLNSDLPGPVIAQVTQDVYDSVTGRYLLVPQGAKLIGKYDSVVAFGQSRVLLIWTRLIMPDGNSIVLDNLQAADTKGYAGLKDGVDYHFWKLLRGVALSSLLGVSSALATNNVAGGNGSGNLIISLGQSGDQATNQAGQQIVSHDLGVQPTLSIRPGFQFDVMVNRDIVLRAYAGS
ncbi:conjugal transfer protein TrbI [Acidiphilium sp. PA]|uniref:TrbI/VirB10 family protein n=1 Tax=Acidiphilium sp. PA TaxID=2871705 RepID=UPI002242CB7F|nr:TrbI/VirB10 family protein [Acidiphilium sp. PA]MCW8309202.1 conjugal transfer protein TrbI [Acidiphilium sp. PA]